MFLFLVIGLIFAFSPAGGIIHEVGHYLCASSHGYFAEIVAWDRTILEVVTIDQVWAGYSFEFVVYTILFIIAAAFRKSILKYLLFGAMIGVFLFAFNSHDFVQLVDYIAKDQSSADALRWLVKVRWTIACGPVLLVCGVVTIMHHAPISACTESGKQALQSHRQ